MKNFNIIKLPKCYGGDSDDYGDGFEIGGVKGNCSGGGTAYGDHLGNGCGYGSGYVHGSGYEYGYNWTKGRGKYPKELL
jgi:hypothetical protein